MDLSRMSANDLLFFAEEAWRKANNLAMSAEKLSDPEPNIAAASMWASVSQAASALAVAKGVQKPTAARNHPAS
jgi:hypothetical protein